MTKLAELSDTDSYNRAGKMHSPANTLARSGLSSNTVDIRNFDERTADNSRSFASSR